MGRRKKNAEEVKSDFDIMFGEFCAESLEDEKEPFFKVAHLDGTLSQPCAKCGRYPRLHVANFSKGEIHPNAAYIDCGCGECDGEWYPDSESALEAWNARNLGAKARKPDEKDSYDFIEEIMSDVRFFD